MRSPIHHKSSAVAEMAAQCCKVEQWNMAVCQFTGKLWENPASVVMNHITTKTI